MAVIVIFFTICQFVRVDTAYVNTRPDDKTGFNCGTETGMEFPRQKAKFPALLAA